MTVQYRMVERQVRLRGIVNRGTPRETFSAAWADVEALVASLRGIYPSGVKEIDAPLGSAFEVTYPSAPGPDWVISVERETVTVPDLHQFAVFVPARASFRVVVQAPTEEAARAYVESLDYHDLRQIGEVVDTVQTGEESIIYRTHDDD